MRRQSAGERAGLDDWLGLAAVRQVQGISWMGRQMNYGNFGWGFLLGMFVSEILVALAIRA